MLEGKTAVFLSCSHTFLDRLAWPIRRGLDADGYRAVIVEDEPLLPHTGWEPDAKVNAYLDASEAMVALCTPDNRVTSPKRLRLWHQRRMECRQNIIDEIERARHRSSLKDVVYIMKEASVTLPSNINPTTDELSVNDPAAALALIRRQLETWGVKPVPRPMHPAAAPPTDRVEQLLDGIHLGDHEEAERRMMSVLSELAKDEQHELVGEVYAGLGRSW